MRKIFLSLILLAAPALAADMPPPPRITVGVVQCGEVIALWIFAKDGKILRLDAGTHPDQIEEYNKVLAWAKSGEQDVLTLPCDGRKAPTT